MSAADERTRERFRELVGERFGLAFEPSRRALVDEVLARRLAATGLDPASYLDALAGRSVSGASELDHLAHELTIGETYFFRHAEQLAALVSVALPERLAARAATRHLRLVSAACSTGEEAYTLAMLLREHVPERAAWDISIRAVDVNPAALARARRGRYSTWALRETPPELARRYFQPRGTELELDPQVRADVSFEQVNLTLEQPQLWQPESLDVIFCRNMIMYLHPERARALIERMARALVPGGFLFLGHAETLRELSEDFEVEQSHGAFYYRRPEGQPLRAGAGAAGASWAERIGEASARVESIARGGATEATPAPPPAAAASDVADAAALAAHARDLRAEERHAEALALVEAHPEARAHDPELRLLHAVLLIDASRFDAAEAACAELRRGGQRLAEAHYLLALCREHAGERDAALEHQRTALFHDPGFALARLQLGLLHRRGGDAGEARRQLGQALILLEGEDAARLALLGGGFTRATLLELCRTQLIASGGRP